MTHKFTVYLMDENHNYQTRRIGGVKNILIHWDEEFTYDEIVVIHENAERIKKGPYGFDVYYVEKGTNKYICTRSSVFEFMNLSTARKDWRQHLDTLYGRG